MKCDICKAEAIALTVFQKVKLCQACIEKSKNKRLFYDPTSKRFYWLTLEQLDEVVMHLEKAVAILNGAKGD